jgi:hypothetical protein
MMRLTNFCSFLISRSDHVTMRHTQFTGGGVAGQNISGSVSPTEFVYNWTHIKLVVLSPSIS